ncbi:MAG: hypothetical protein IT323_06890 [Anaerolineae bacterium]|nr:hypothetical protein [Anaerolineae bacterium]
MELTFLVIADYATATPDGKLTLVGIFTEIRASAFPARHGALHLVAQLLASPHEYGRQFALEFKLVDEDGQLVMSLPVSAQVPHGDKGQRVYLNNMVRLENIVFPKPGRYEFAILVDHDLKGTLPFEVIEQPAPRA